MITRNSRRPFGVALSLLLGVSLVLPLHTLAQETEEEETRIKIRTKNRQVFVVDGDDDPVQIAPIFFPGTYLGVDVVNLTPELRLHFGVSEEAGVMISTVAEETPAAEAGLQVGDVLTAVSGEAIDTSWELARLVRKREAGDEIDLELWRDGRVQTLTATLAEHDRPAYNIAPMMEVLDDGETIFLGEDGPLRLEIDTERIQALAEEWKERLEDSGFHERIEHFRMHGEDVRERMRQLEERLKELEAELKSEHEEDV